MDGIYSMTFRGAVGWGMGMLVLRRGKVAGADAQGVRYDGEYSETSDDLRLDLEMVVPPGVSLVQGTPPRPIQYSLPFTATVPRHSIDAASPVLVQLPPGPVNVIVRRLRPLDA